jgi:hypothetical protein
MAGSMSNAVPTFSLGTSGFLITGHTRTARVSTRKRLAQSKITRFVPTPNVRWAAWISGLGFGPRTIPHSPMHAEFAATGSRVSSRCRRLRTALRLEIDGLEAPQSRCAIGGARVSGRSRDASRPVVAPGA